MTFPISYLLFFSTLLMGTFLSISSTSWFGAWLGLELNLISFIPLITTKLSPFFSEAAVKYFLVQALASTILIMSSSIYMYTPDFSYTLILISLMIKLGAAPLHFWFPQVIEGLSWPQAFILLTIQKIAPMFLMSYMTFNHTLMLMITFMALFSSLIGALGGLNVMKLRKLMAFSSINHMSWMLIAISINDSMWLIYFLFYSFTSGSVIILLYYTDTYTLSNVLNQNNKNEIFTFLIPMNLLSLGGLPPFLGFIPKWIMIQLFSSKLMIFILLVLLFSSLITLYFYLRLFIPMILLSFSSLPSSLKFYSSFSRSPVLIASSFINLFGILSPIPFLI
uniref:NADH-ubiquinone oxidoreductase chain 2 n=1 Tax=Charybdis bimaculata TaxID=1295081 RepID=A0A343VYQ6_9EUCA|nr:NADH dehydrogenase subunit 2 [Charybdis bimaculata]AVQ04903.1 NADH dehydrogenase subunit 2 [Charybdis bimaculata]AXB37185.1 NADH dehydrogenase subunit 2 [Charybdis bimaculata]